MSLVESKIYMEGFHGRHVGGQKQYISYLQKNDICFHANMTSKPFVTLRLIPLLRISSSRKYMSSRVQPVSGLLRRPGKCFRRIRGCCLVTAHDLHVFNIGRHFVLTHKLGLLKALKC